MARLLYRLGRFSARHSIATVSAWGLTLLVLAVITLTGMKFSEGGFDIPGTESSTAMAVVQDEFPDTKADPGTGALQVVLQVDDDQEITSPENAARIADVIAELSAVTHVDAVSNPLDPAQPYVSSDLDTVVITVSLTDVTEENAEGIYDDILEIAGQQRADFANAEVGGHIGSNVPEILGPTEIVGVAVAFLVLLLTFGSLVAAGANMLGAIAGVAVGILGVLAASAINPIGSVTPILAVMLGLAVSIDYGLFVLARYRAELRHGKRIDEAIGVAVGTAGSSVVFAGVTVIIALVGLAVVNIPFITEMGLAGALAVLVAILMAVTLMPAFMRLMGLRALPRKERTRYARSSRYGDEPDARVTGMLEASRAPSAVRIGFLERWVALIVRRPLVALTGAVAVLAMLAVPVLSMKTSLATPGGEDPDSSQRAAYTLIADEFGDGAQSPLVILAEGDDIEARTADISADLESMSDVDAVIPTAVNDAGNAAIFTVIPKSGPVDASTKELVRDIRGADIAGAEIRVTGETAIGIDVDQKLSDALVLYIALIVGLSLILLMIMFRSILVPIVATGGFLLSLGAGLGATVAVFQWGWLDVVFAAPLGNPMLSLLPILIVGILFGLAMDYQVFLVSRMHEAYVKGLSPKEAILDGFGRTAFVVVAAAAIMAAVFGGFALSPSSLVASIALALAVGVLADAFIVRMIIVPAVLSLLGRAAWWMPRWMQKALPHLDTEGQALEKGQS